jgi:hypothetical protein
MKKRGKEEQDREEEIYARAAHALNELRSCSVDRERLEGHKTPCHSGRASLTAVVMCQLGLDLSDLGLVAQELSDHLREDHAREHRVDDGQM